ncbi:MAG: endopeptidase [Acidobacteria bacterium]|nr:MAG: endopeptidase [Acidobacteriota bacterium]
MNRNSFQKIRGIFISLLIGFFSGALVSGYLLLRYGSSDMAAAESGPPSIVVSPSNQSFIAKELPSKTQTAPSLNVKIQAEAPAKVQGVPQPIEPVPHPGIIEGIPAKPDPREAVTTSKPMMDAVAELRARNLMLPVRGLKRENLRDSFSEARTGHIHEAIDILAPRNTPVYAVEDGTIARLWYSALGGITIYQFDPQKEYEYYYAHLEKYAPDLKEGQEVKKGQIIGFVGTSGNAPKDTPHLHFSIYRLTEQRHWWEGTPINPYLVFR